MYIIYKYEIAFMVIYTIQEPKCHVVKTVIGVIGDFDVYMVET